MSDEFLKVAKAEILSELGELKRIATSCNDDEHIFENSLSIREHMHKIRGLAPMIDSKDVGEIAKTGDIMLRYIIDNGPLPGSHYIITSMINDMEKIFRGFDSYDVSSFKKTVQDRFPQVQDL